MTAYSNEFVPRGLTASDYRAAYQSALIGIAIRDDEIEYLRKIIAAREKIIAARELLTVGYPQMHFTRGQIIDLVVTLSESSHDL